MLRTALLVLLVLHGLIHLMGSAKAFGWAEVAAQGFDERFRRMWNFYLTSCAGAFGGGNCDVTQITVTRP